MTNLKTVFWAVLFTLIPGSAAIAQDVTLTSRDGSVEIIGTLLGYDGEFYRVNSVYGVLTVDGSGVLCSGSGCPDLSAFVATITVSGATAPTKVLFPALLAAFANQQDYKVVQTRENETHQTIVMQDPATGLDAATFDIQTSNSAEGFADLLAEEADIALSLREALPDEVARATQAGFGQLNSRGQSRVIALDALVPVVSIRNPIQQISPENLARLFAGEIDNWEPLNGLDAPIVLNLRAAGSGSLQVFLDRIIAPSQRVLSNRVTRHETNAQLLKAVESDPFAIGLSNLSDIGNTRAVGLIGGCGFRTEAQPEALKSNDYPLTAPVFLYKKAQRLPAVGREFMRFIQSPAAQIAVLRAGYVDQAIARTPVARQGNRLANAIRSAGEEIELNELQRLVGAMGNSRRLSITFRFTGGSSQLDAQSRSNVALLAGALETGLLGSKELVFVGFSDGEGDAEPNKRLSLQRAASVKAAVIKEAKTLDPKRLSLSIDGFGEAMPMACDDTEWGRQINRRVEVWAR